MDLSNDLIAKFVKITNDEGEKQSKESIVYGTTVEYDGEMYVRIDGSDLLTPVDTTANIKDDERVTVMIKDHNATVTGNISDPSASSTTVGTLGSQITEFDIVIAEKVSTEFLEAEVAQIETLIAEKADIAELTVIKADIEELNATNATIGNLVAGKADILELNATNANIEVLDAEIADIQTLVNGNLTSDNILSLNLTSSNTTIQNALIKSAMIDSIAADKIQTGVLDTNSVTIQSEDGSMILTGSVQQFKDENGVVRIQIGKDGGGNFTFILYDETGKGILIDESGIQSSDALADGLIVDAKVAEGANISGGKLDISSVITEINDDDSTTIKSNKIYLDDQGQTLTVAFNALKSQVETIEDINISGNLSTIIEQVQSNTTEIEISKNEIETLIAENTIITKEVSDLEGNVVELSTEMDSKFTSFSEDLDGFKTIVNQSYALKEEVNNIENNLSTNYSTTQATQSFIDQKANEITTNVSDTYATKQTVTNLEGKIESEYSNTEAMHSAINQTAAQITNSVNATYATKETVTNLEGKIESEYSTTEAMNSAINQKANEITTNVSGTYATKQTVTNLEGKLQSEYSTTEAMHSALNQTANQIATSVSETYVTKETVTNLEGKIESEYSTTEAMNSAINQKANQITNSVNATYATKDTVTQLAGQVQVNAGELEMKVSRNDIVSSINMTPETTKIKTDLLDLEGDLDLQGTFKCWKSNSDKTGNYLYMNGAMMFGYNATGGVNPVFASGLWTDQNMGYFSVGYTRADIVDENGCLYMTPLVDNTGCRLSFSRLVDNTSKASGIYFRKDGSIDFIQNLHGNNTTDNVYTYRFDSGVSTQSFKCDNIRTANIYPNANGAYNLGSASLRYKNMYGDAVCSPSGELRLGTVTTNGTWNGIPLAISSNTIYPATSASMDLGSTSYRFRNAICDMVATTNAEMKIGTVNSSGAWQTYGPLLVNSLTGYVTPLYNANLSLGSSSLRFHTLFCVNSPNVSSDRRMKTDIHYLGTPYEPEVVNGRSRVNMNITTSDMRDFIRNDLKLASYRYKVNIGKEDTTVDYGFIAQDVLYTKVGSEIVQLEDRNDLDSNLSVNQGNYVATIAGALQEEIKVRDEQINELEEKIVSRLEEEIKMKDARIENLENRLMELENIIKQLIDK